MIEEQAVIGNIPWEVTVEPSRAKIAEFGQLAALYADTKEFGVETKDTALVISFGDEKATRRLANGSVRASGEMRALLGALRQQKQED